MITPELTTYFPKSLNLEEKEKCEGILTKAECLQALKGMKSGKTPGSDGLPVDFYNVFWNEISDCLLNTINYSYTCLLYTSPSPRDLSTSRMPSSA